MGFDEPIYLTRQQALQQAHAEARRDLIVTDTTLRYVAFDPTFNDWCRMEFVRQPKGWVRTLTSLPMANGKWQMAKGKGQRAKGKGQRADDPRPMPDTRRLTPDA